MSLNELFLIYIIIGVCITIYDWEKFRKYEYKTALKTLGKVDDSIVILYWITLMLCWPIKLFK